MTRILIDAVEDRKDHKKRQGAQFAFECLSQSLKAYFEPYAFEIIPLILSSLGDNSPEVREATSYAAREIMRHSTGYGIKKLVPLALEFGPNCMESQEGCSRAFRYHGLP